MKVRFHVEQDEDGYPPTRWESLWAEPVGDGRYRLDNVPWFARDLADGDARDSLSELGCETELSHLPELASVDVPPEVDMTPVLAFLAAGEEAGRWDYETGWVADPHLDAFS